MRKIDIRVVPPLCIMFLLAFLDKVNIATAEVFGMSEEINIDKGTQYNNAVSWPMRIALLFRRMLTLLVFSLSSSMCPTSFSKFRPIST